MRQNNFTERLFKIMFYLVHCQLSQHFLTGTFFEHLIQIKLRRSMCQIHILFHYGFLSSEDQMQFGQGHAVELTKWID